MRPKRWDPVAEACPGEHPEQLVRSALRHPIVASYAGGDPARLRRMLETYAASAQWHVENMAMPSLTMPYERVTGQPLAATRAIARFLEVRNPLRILRAAAFVGKNRARVRLFVTKVINLPRFELGRLKNEARAFFGGRR